MRWEAGSTAGCTRVGLRSVQSEDLWVQTTTDGVGHYEAEMPGGTYLVESAIGRGENKAIKVEVRRDDTARADLVLKAPRGAVVPAGSGQTVEAGPGIRQGLWHSFGVRDGLYSPTITSTIQDRQGHLWFGTGGGVSRYDGKVFQNLSRRNGLANNGVHKVVQDRRGDFWITTNGGGVTRYRPQKTPPPVWILDVMADRRYGAVEELRLPSSQHLVLFEFFGRSFKTHREQMAYVYRLAGYEDEWKTTRETQVQYDGLPVGEYVFQIKAVDRDLNYSDVPAEVRLTVHPPYLQLALFCGLGLALVGLLVASGYGIRRRRERDRAQQERDQAQEQLAQERRRERDRAREQLVRERRQRIEVQPHDIEQWTLDDFVEQSLGMRLLFEEMANGKQRAIAGCSSRGKPGPVRN